MRSHVDAEEGVETQEYLVESEKVHKGSMVS